MEKPQRILLINANCGNFVWFGRQKVFNRSRLLPLSSPYFIRVPRHFLLLSAKIRKNIGICKFIGKIVQIVETGPLYINKVTGGIDKCHLFSDNGRLLRNKAGLFPNKCHLLWKECHIVTLTASLSPCRHPCHPQKLDAPPVFIGILSP